MLRLFFRYDFRRYAMLFASYSVCLRRLLMFSPPLCCHRYAVTLRARRQDDDCLPATPMPPAARIRMLLLLRYAMLLATRADAGLRATLLLLMLHTPLLMASRAEDYYATACCRYALPYASLLRRH